MSPLSNDNGNIVHWRRIANDANVLMRIVQGGDDIGIEIDYYKN